MKKGKVTTELGKWLKAANSKQQLDLCEQTGTTMSYLRLLSNAYRENPKVRLALSLVYEANKITATNNKPHVVMKTEMPYITLIGLATPSRRASAWCMEHGYVDGTGRPVSGDADDE